MEQTYLFNHDHKKFTCYDPKNTFIIDNSNGYPVILTTDVTKNTKWSDIFKGNYELANPNGITEYLSVNGKKYTYIDLKYATKYLGYKFVEFKDSDDVTRWKSRFDKKIENFCKKVF